MRKKRTRRTARDKLLTALLGCAVALLPLLYMPELRQQLWTDPVGLFRRKGSPPMTPAALHPAHQQVGLAMHTGICHVLGVLRGVRATSACLLSAGLGAATSLARPRACARRLHDRRGRRTGAAANRAAL